MDVSQLLSDKGLRPVDLARVIGCHKSYVSHLTGNRKRLSRPAALAIFKEYRIKMGPLEALSDAECRVLAKLQAKAA